MERVSFKFGADIILTASLLFGLVGCGGDAEPEYSGGTVDSGLASDGAAIAAESSPAPADSVVTAVHSIPENQYSGGALPMVATQSAAEPHETGQPLDCLIEPSEISEVATSIAGVLEEVTVGRGDRVETGQVIARLRSNVEKANVNLARAELKFRERNYKRWQEMQNYASSYEKDEAQNRLEIARYDLERAEQILNERIIKSPFNGVVVEQYLYDGELSEDRKIFKLARIDMLNVEVIAPVHLLGKIRKGMQAKVYPEGPVEGPFLASVTVVDPIVDAASGTLGMRLELPNPDYRIPAGVKCGIDFEGIDLQGK